MMIQSSGLSAISCLRHAFFTREGGVSGGIYASLNGGLGSADERALVLENRARMAAVMGVSPGHLVSVHQVHSADVVVVDAPFVGERPKADAMVTNVPGLALAIATADCGPILFADPAAGVIGAAHAGWKGAFGGVVEATVTAMEGLGASRVRIIAALGPTIGPSAYEVGPEFVARLMQESANHARFFSPSGRDSHAMFNLPGFIAEKAHEAGIGHFTDLALCTCSDEKRFYSYRRTTHRKEPDYGRLISAIALADQASGPTF